MTLRLTRRHFVMSSLSAAVSPALIEAKRLFARSPQAAKRPVSIASSNRVTPPDGIPYYGGIRASQKAIEIIRAGGDPLDGVIAGINLVEDDPNDMSVGYGGLPNEEGEVELDAAVMHGPTGRAGAVAALKHIKNPTKVARLVMEETDHVLLVGEGALRFALSFGFKKEDLLTERSRKAWLEWRAQRGEQDHWAVNKIRASVNKERSADFSFQFDRERHTGSIACLAINEAGDLAGVTSTSGLGFKVPGRVGDLAIIGAGLYIDNDVGAAGSTGWGEDNIRICGAHTIVESMRRGMSPVDACLEAIKRLSKLYGGKPEHQLKFYALNKNGEYGSGAVWKGEVFAITDSRGSRVEEMAYLFEKRPT